MVVHIISVAFTSFMMYLSSPGSDLFSWHPICMTVAFILLLLQAIALFSPESSLLPTIPKQVSKTYIDDEIAFLLGHFIYKTLLIDYNRLNSTHF